VKVKRGTIIANGQPRDIELPSTVADFVRTCGFTGGQVVVEYNGNVLRHNAMESANLKNGDSLEIIVPVAGG
jgi:thiamine biosynthesis protein ThiS